MRLEPAPMAVPLRLRFQDNSPKPRAPESTVRSPHWSRPIIPETIRPRRATRLNLSRNRRLNLFTGTFRRVEVAERLDRHLAVDRATMA